MVSFGCFFCSQLVWNRYKAFYDMNTFTVSWAVCYCWHRTGNSCFKCRSQRSACEALMNTSFDLLLWHNQEQSSQCWITVGLLSRCTNSCGIDSAPSYSKPSLFLCPSLVFPFLRLFWFVCELHTNCRFTSWINCWPCFSLLVLSCPAALFNWSPSLMWRS